MKVPKNVQPTRLSSEGGWCCEASDFNCIMSRRNGLQAVPTLEYKSVEYSNPIVKRDEEGDILWWDYKSARGDVFRVFND